MIGEIFTYLGLNYLPLFLVGKFFAKQELTEYFPSENLKILWKCKCFSLHDACCHWCQLKRIQLRKTNHHFEYEKTTLSLSCIITGSGIWMLWKALTVVSVLILWCRGFWRLGRDPCRDQMEGGGYRNSAHYCLESRICFFLCHWYSYFVCPIWHSP